MENFSTFHYNNRLGNQAGRSEEESKGYMLCVTLYRSDLQETFWFTIILDFITK